MQKIIFLSVLICTVLCQAEQVVWQQGKPDGSSKEFKPNYHAWEYGNAPAIQNSPAMDHKTHTFHYAIKTNQVIPDPQIVSGLVTESAQQWMNADEIVSNLRLSWNEEEAGIRRLEFCVVDWSNPFAEKDGIEVTLPDGGIKSFNLPDTKRKWNGEKEPLKFTVTFAVKTGENRLDIKIVAMANHHKFQFDSIILSSTSTPPEPLPPALRVQFNKEDGIYHPGDEASLTLTGYNFPDGEGKIDYVIEDAFAAKIAEGRAELKNSRTIIHLPSCQRGYFKLKSTSKGLALNAPYVVIEPVKAEYIADSRFGCHALAGDSPHLNFWREFHETTMRRAFLAGARWVRYHSMHWSSREPEKGKFDWTSFDEPLALAEKYKMNPLLVLGRTAAWASTSKDRKMNIWGFNQFQVSPPENWKNWADFLGTVVHRYKEKVKWYELWNEPGFRSAFWAGSAEDYAMLLKTGYEAVKEADPKSVVLSGAPLTADFMREVIRCNDGKFYFDVMSVHYLQAGKSQDGIIKKWRNCMEQAGGGNIPMVNTEEMDWKSGENSLERASLLIKSHMREAARGIEKTFAFDLFRSGSIYNASAFDYQSKVLPVYAAYRTMTHHLEYANFVDHLSTGEIEAYLFDRQGTPVIVFWSAPGSEWELPFGAERISEINMMDVETLKTTTAGKLAIKTSPYPQFIVGGDLKTLREYAKILRSVYPAMTMPGKLMVRNLNWSNRIADLKWDLPVRWQGAIANSEMTISVPPNASSGVYDIDIRLSLDGINLTVPFLVEVTGSVPGGNLVDNGDFSKKTSYWLGPSDQERFKFLQGAGVNGGNAVRTKGAAYFGHTVSIKVRKGEKYALIVEARGQGHFGGVYSVKDKNGKTLFPQREGINCLNGMVEPDWKTFGEEIAIVQPDAATLQFALLANHGDKEGREVDFNRVAIVRLNHNYTLDKAIWQGICTQTSGMPQDWNKIPAMTAASAYRVVAPDHTGWSGKEDLSASCQMAMDASSLYLRFTVRDDIHIPTSGKKEDGWRYDSVQFAIDPTMEGKDRTEILISEDGNGKVFAYKHNNFWTPELLEGLTIHGPMSDTNGHVEKSPGKIVYTIRVPLRELYPLSAKTEEFGFSWLVNDNDGNGRKYIQWSSGIGPSKTPALFGCISTR